MMQIQYKMSFLTYKEIDLNRIVLEPVKEIVNGAISFKRINIKYIMPNGTREKLSIKTPELFSWGVAENRSMDKSKDLPPDSYQMSLVMYDAREVATQSEDERGTVEVLEKIVKKIKAHLKDDATKAAMKKYQLDPFVDLMDMFYRKKGAGGKIDPNYAPTLYAKLYTHPAIAGAAPIIKSGFFDSDDRPIDPLSMIGTRSRCICEVVIDNIYIGQKPSIQIKINDCIVMSRAEKVRRLFAPKKAPVTDCVFDDDYTTVDAE